MIENNYDVIIVGGGPAGYTAALYTTRAGFKTLVIEKIYAGGQMSQTSQIDNYPGFEDGINGFELGSKMQDHAIKYGTSVLNDEVVSVELNGENKTVKTKDKELTSKCVIIATGARHKHLGIEKEDVYIGRGIHYCATCDGAFYRNKTVVVVGGGNSAVADALFLSRICSKVIIVHRRDEFRATQIYYDQLEDAHNIVMKMDSVVEGLLIEDSVMKGVKIFNKKNNKYENIQADGIFISIGIEPNSQVFKDKVKLDEQGYVCAMENTKTNIDGVYAIGDVRTKDVRQVVTAVSDGAVAAYEMEKFLLKK